ncbi:MAG: sulfotransferase family protein [Haliea sp.]|nr:sulfotransferase family protein [Haliea sp.]
MGGQVANELDGKLPTRVVAVLGMHRSGTSCLTGSLQNAGLFLGDCHTWNKHNEKGNRENQKFVDLHDAILAANGGAWDAPPASVVWKDEHFAWARELLLAHAGEPNFGFKDPRGLLVIDGWKQLYPRIEFIGIYRHPNAVAKSLQKRNYRTREEWLNLWYAYNSALYREYKSKPFPILCFDDDEAVLDEKIVRAAAQMGLTRHGPEEKFYTSELRHNDGSGEAVLPWKIRRLYRKLKKAEF